VFFFAIARLYPIRVANSNRQTTSPKQVWVLLLKKEEKLLVYKKSCGSHATA